MRELLFAHSHILEWTFLVLIIGCFVLSVQAVLFHLSDQRLASIGRRSSDRAAQHMARANLRNSIGLSVMQAAMLIAAFAFVVSEPPPPDPIPRQTQIKLFMLLFVSSVMGGLSLFTRYDRRVLRDLFENAKASWSGGKRVTDIDTGSGPLPVASAQARHLHLRLSEATLQVRGDVIAVSTDGQDDKVLTKLLQQLRGLGFVITVSP
jgi:hypothetical protein